MVLSFRQSIGPGVEGCGNVLLSPYLGGQSSAKVQGKPRIPICNDFLWEAKPQVNVLEIKGGYSWTGDCDRAREKHGSLRISMIDNGEDGILSSYIWKSCDEIHSDLLEGEGIFWGSDTIERDSRPMSKVLILLAYRTSSNVISDPGLHPFPL